MGKGGHTSGNMEVVDTFRGAKRELMSYAISPAEEQKWHNKKRGEMGRHLSEALDTGLSDNKSVLRTTAKEVAKKIAEAKKIKTDVHSENVLYQAKIAESFSNQEKLKVEQSVLSKDDPNYQKDLNDRERLIAEESQKLRELMMNLIFTSPVFKEKYIAWKAEYESKKGDTNFMTLYPSIEHYVLRKGQEYIDSRRNDVIEGRLGNLPHLKEMEEEDKKKEKARMLAESSAFVNEFYDDLLVYSSLENDDPTKLRMIDALKKRLNLKNVKDEEILGILIGIATDVYVAEAAKVNFIAAHIEMVAVVEDAIKNNNGIIDDEEWNERILGAIQANADEVLNERCATGDVSLHLSGFDNIGSEQSFGSPTAVAHYAGVNIVGQVGDNEYIVRFPGSSYQTRMRIEPVIGEEGRWSVKALDRFRDPSEVKWVDLQMGDLRYGFNKMFLDFQLDSLRYRRIGTQSPNAVIKDLPMMDIAMHLFGWDKTKMGTNVVTTPERRDLFTNLMVVMLKDEKSINHGNLGSLQERVRKMGIVLKNPKYAVNIRSKVKVNGGKVWTVSTLLDAINYPKQTGEEITSIPIS